MPHSSCPIPETVPPSAHDVEQLARIFKALGHPVRLNIVGMLLEHERCVCELQAHSGRDMSTISSHLNILKACGILTAEQRGKNVYYSLRCPCIRQIICCLTSSLPSCG